MSAQIENVSSDPRQSCPEGMCSGVHTAASPKRASAAEWENAPKNWVVLRVLPQTEFQTATALRASGFAALVPYERKFRRYGSRRRRVPRDYPLFPRYVFADMLSEAKLASLTGVSGVSGILTAGGRVYRLSGPEIGWIRSLAERCDQIEGINLHTALQRGQWARIAEGPLSGLLGYVDAIRGQRASMLLEMLGVWRSVDVPLADLEAA